ncbi:hypothetical protein GCM10009718_01570 [Isoptericola halotolerans]
MTSGQEHGHGDPDEVGAAGHHGLERLSHPAGGSDQLAEACAERVGAGFCGRGRRVAGADGAGGVVGLHGWALRMVRQVL